MTKVCFTSLIYVSEGSLEVIKVRMEEQFP